MQARPKFAVPSTLDSVCIHVPLSRSLLGWTLIGGGLFSLIIVSGLALDW